jgi:hypothetical protein
MRKHVPLSLMENRIRGGQYGSDESYGLAGAFKLIGPSAALLVVMSSGVDHEQGWEHVSVSAQGRPPTWAEMCFVKNLFWSEEELVVQYHPPRSEYVDFHPHCLHLWKPINMVIPMPPSLLVGPKSGHTR